MAEAHLSVPGSRACKKALRFCNPDLHLPFTGSLTQGASGLAASWARPPRLRLRIRRARRPGPQGAGCRVAGPRVRVREQDSASRRQRAPGAEVPRPGAAREAQAEARRASGSPCHVPGRARRRQVGAGSTGSAWLRAGPPGAGAGGRDAAGGARWRAGRLCASRRAFRAGPGKSWGGALASGAGREVRRRRPRPRAGRRTRGDTRGPQRSARLQVAAGGRGTQQGGGDRLASSLLRPRGPAESWGPLVAFGVLVGKELNVVSCVAGSRTAPPGASFTSHCGAFVLGKLSGPRSGRYV